MRSETETIEIAAPPTVVFDYLTDQATLSDWLPGLIRSEVVGGGPVQTGSKLAQIREQGGRRMEGEATVITHDRPSMHAVQVNIMGITTSFAFQLTASKFGTNVVLRSTYSGSGIKVLFEGLIAAMCRECNKKTVAALKAAVEQKQACKNSVA